MLAAARELEEETGYRPGRLENLGEYYSSPGMVSESFSLFRAHDLMKTGEGGGVEGEDILVHRVPLNAIHDRIAAWRMDGFAIDVKLRSEEHKSELQSLMRISYAVFCLNKKKNPC